MYYSEDGGKTFRTDLVQKIHGDHHALWIDPADSDHMLLGTDGGIHLSYDRGRTWDYLNTVPLAQFYEVGADIGSPTGSAASTPCARRVKLMEQAVHPGLRGRDRSGAARPKVQAFVQVRLTRHTDENVEQFRRAVDAMEEVVSCHAMTGAYDLLLQVVVTDLEQLSNVVLKKLMHIRFVRDVHSSIVLNTIKRSSRVPVRHLVR